MSRASAVAACVCPACRPWSVAVGGGDGLVRGSAVPGCPGQSPVGIDGAIHRGGAWNVPAQPDRWRHRHRWHRAVDASQADRGAKRANLACHGTRSSFSPGLRSAGARATQKTAQKDQEGCSAPPAAQPGGGLVGARAARVCRIRAELARARLHAVARASMSPNDISVGRGRTRSCV